jgi:hypothetical protein
MGVHKPVVLGEPPADGARRHPPDLSPPEYTLGEALEFAVTAGYAGAWPWSFSGTDEYGSFPERPLLEFAARHGDLVNRRCRVRLKPDPTRTSG